MGAYQNFLMLNLDNPDTKDPEDPQSSVRFSASRRHLTLTIIVAGNLHYLAHARS